MTKCLRCMTSKLLNKRQFRNLDNTPRSFSILSFIDALTCVGGMCFPLSKSSNIVPKLKTTLSGVTLPTSTGTISIYLLHKTKVLNILPVTNVISTKRKGHSFKQQESI